MIGHGALVTAKIKAASVVVAGTVSGEITATERIEIRPSAKISGNLTAPRIAMHEGAMFEGHCAMKPEEVAKKEIQHSFGTKNRWKRGLQLKSQLEATARIEAEGSPGWFRSAALARPLAIECRRISSRY